VLAARLLVFAALPVLAGVAQSDEDFHVYTDAPRLLLSKQRLRLLQRERERQSMRWEQFDALISGGAPMPEPGFAWALYFQVSKNPAAGRKAVEWALGDANDLRQLALVFDWCVSMASEAQAARLSAKIQKALAAAAPPDDFRVHAARALAAIAISDRLPDHGEALLRAEIEGWWRGPVVKRIESGHALPREQLYWIYEMLHAVRDNLKIDLRESVPAYFRSLPVDHLASHYPAPYEAAENEYRVPVYVRDGEPDLNDAAMSRAAEMAMVAYDDNATESQFLQGWLMQDRFLMRGALGSVYEFMWANPYQPGLSYFHTPLIFHDAFTGHVFARTSWDENATWIGYFDGHLQMFRDGHVEMLRAGVATKPVHIGDALLLSADSRDATRFRADAEAVFVLNLAPRAAYDVEIDDQELWECETDAGGTLVLSFPEGAPAGVRIRRR
jgi:hypothetical protein